MTYLFLGSDPLSVDTQIESIKKKFLTTNEALKFDLDILHAHKLPAEALKKSLIALPALAAKRVVVIREIHKLTEQNRALIFHFIDTAPDHAVLILESEEWTEKDSFVQKISPKVKMVQAAQGRKFNVFDVTNAISRHQSAEALKMVHVLLEQGDHPLQLMGGLVWYWGKMRDKISSEAFKKGLLVLQEADINIKRSRMNPEHALELAIVQLSA